MKYLISVIVPIYKVEKFVERCLISLFDQTIASQCEFILVNDASPDSSFDIAKKVVSKYKSLMDNIVFIDNSEVVSTGVHNDLLENKLYKKVIES